MGRKREGEVYRGEGKTRVWWVRRMRRGRVLAGGKRWWLQNGRMARDVPFG